MLVQFQQEEPSLSKILALRMLTLSSGPTSKGVRELIGHVKRMVEHKVIMGSSRFLRHVRQVLLVALQ